LVEGQGPCGVGDNQADMMDGSNLVHRVGVGMEAVSGLAYTSSLARPKQGPPDRVSESRRHPNRPRTRPPSAQRDAGDSP
jgi:hypothetical protein